MPCLCWYEPSEESKKKIKYHCKEIVDEIHRLRKIGDPIGLNIDEVHKLLEHLYDPSSCDEKT